MIARRRWLLWAGLAYAAILVAVTLGLAQLHADAQDRLEEAMGQRLLGIARSAATLCDGELAALAALGDPGGRAYLEELSAAWGALQRAESLSEITLTDADSGLILATSSSAQGLGEPDGFRGLDAGAEAAARGGVAASGQLYAPGGPAGTTQMSAHAPVYNYSADGAYLVGVLRVSGSPDFFTALGRLRRAAWLTVAAVLAVLAALGLVLQRIVAALERARESARRQENLAAMGRMTAGIAHEIRNPLGIIRGAGQHLERVLADAGISDEVAGFIPEEVDRLDRILAGYLAFGSDQPGPVEVFDLAACLGRGARLVAEELKGCGVAVEGPAAAGSCPVRGDPRRLQQVCLNLLLNARDAMPGGGMVRIDLEPDPGAGRVHVAFTDEGTGLAGVDRRRLFEPFQTTKEKGSGLGLAISRRIVEDMGGTLELGDRTDRRGAVARLELPLANPGKG